MKKIWNLPIVDLLPFSEVMEMRPVLLVTSAPAWNAVKEKIHLTIAQQVEVKEANTEPWDSLLIADHQLPPGVVYAVGGGLVQMQPNILPSNSACR
jgi:hypothetical protein